MQAGEDFTARIRLGSKLNKERREETRTGLFIDLSEIEVVIDDGS
jgi:hypothetical protein